MEDKKTVGKNYEKEHYDLTCKFVELRQNRDEIEKELLTLHEKSKKEIEEKDKEINWLKMIIKRTLHIDKE